MAENDFRRATEVTDLGYRGRRKSLRLSAKNLLSEGEPLLGSLRIIGLLGGVASGKSLVAEQFRALGAGVLDADRAGHETLHEPEIKAALRNQFGDAVLDDTGEVDRQALADQVFGSQAEHQENLAFLERLTHPRIADRLESQAEAIAESGATIAILDAAVMLRAGWNRVCDFVLFVEAPDEVRLARALSRGWTESEFRAREAAQESLETKRGFADQVIDNSASAAYTQSQVERFWRFLVSSPPGSEIPPESPFSE
jgi:dephospho-CoA kinase